MVSRCINECEDERTKGGELSRIGLNSKRFAASRPCGFLPSPPLMDDGS